MKKQFAVMISLTLGWGLLVGCAGTKSNPVASYKDKLDHSVPIDHERAKLNDQILVESAFFTLIADDNYASHSLEFTEGIAKPHPLRVVFTFADKINYDLSWNNASTFGGQLVRDPNNENQWSLQWTPRIGYVARDKIFQTENLEFELKILGPKSPNFDELAKDLAQIDTRRQIQAFITRASHSAEIISVTGISSATVYHSSDTATLSVLVKSNNLENVQISCQFNSTGDTAVAKRTHEACSFLSEPTLVSSNPPKYEYKIDFQKIQASIKSSPNEWAVNSGGSYSLMGNFVVDSDKLHPFQFSFAPDITPPPVRRGPR